MNLTAEIESAELQFKQILERFFIAVFDERSLSSHGINHHRRVWSYAVELTKLLAEREIISDSEFPPKLIIACYLHDIGMSLETGIRHGVHSRDLCIRFLEKNHLKKSKYQDVLLAIENHDNKDYFTFAGKYDLLIILSTADDLDAFGFTGIFRYSEIYLTRGTDLYEIGNMIMENASKRFDNFTRTFGFLDALFQIHRRRYDTLINFFRDYNNQVSSYEFGSQQPSGYCGVIEIINDAVKRKIPLQSILSVPSKNSTDEIISWFITGLISDSLDCP